MNIIELIEDERLHLMYPSGFHEIVLLEDISFGLSGSAFISFFIQAKPEVEPSAWVEKYGLWSVNYDLISLRLCFYGLNTCRISFLEKIEVCPLSFGKKNADTYYIHPRGKKWECYVEFKKIKLLDMSGFTPEDPSILPRFL